MKSSVEPQLPWHWEIKSESFWFKWNLKEVWHYRYLLLRLVRRDFLIHHQQTLLGPLWIVFQPIIVLIIYILIFEKAVGLSTDALPSSLFYLSGIILWNLFSECFTGTAFTFVQNSSLFGKVYFPRLIIPLSVAVLNLARFAIQLLLFFLLIIYYVYQYEFVIYPERWILSLIIVSSITAGIGLGLGLIFSILTAKYRDLMNIIHLIVRLLMFATPVIYPFSIVQPDVQSLLRANPLTSLFEFFRFGFLGPGTFSEIQLLYSFVCMVILLGIGTMFFNKFGNKLQDVI